MAPESYAGIVCLGVLAAACSAGSGGTASPLALYPSSPAGDAALLRGRLELEGPCLYIRGEGGERWLAAFPSPGTSWDPEDRSVRVGDRVLRVGGTAGFGGGEAKGEPGALSWVQAPAASCDASRIWLLTSLTGE
jgi:hypothetical protein